MDILLFLASFAAGVCGAMGLGGGSVLILYLTLFCNMDRITAGGVNLFFFLPVGIVSVIVSLKNKMFKIKELFPYIISGSIFSAIGIFAAIYLKSAIVSKMFGGLLLIMGVYEGIKSLKNKG